MTYVGKKLSRRGVAVAIVLALVAGCDSGPSDSEFVTACLAMSPQARQAMIFRMLGKKAEAHAIGEKMSAQEQDAFMKGTMTIFSACTGKAR